MVFPVHLDQAALVAGADLTMVYDPDILSLQELRNGDLLQGGELLVISNTATPGQILVSIAGAQALGVESGTLLELEFLAGIFRPGQNISALRFSRGLFTNEEGQSSSAHLTHGSFTLLPGISGDVNQDESVNSADAVLVLRHAVGLTSLDETQQVLADVNEDGQISAGDAVLILRKAAQLIPKAVVAALPTLDLVWGAPQRTGEGDVVVPLLLEGGIYGGDFVAHYEASTWQPTGLKLAGENAVWVMHTPIPGELRFSVASADPLMRLELVLEGGDDAVRAGLITLDQALVVDRSGQVTTGVSVTAVEDAAAVLPERYALLQNYPNPFNPETHITYHLPRSEEVVLEVYTLIGQRIRTLEDGVVAAGVHIATWDGRDEAGRKASSGVYLVRLQAGHFVDTRRMMLLR